MKFIKQHLLNQASDQTPPGEQTDDFGYAIPAAAAAPVAPPAAPTPAAATPAVVPPVAPPAKPEDQKIGKTVNGYGDEPPAEVPPAATPPPAPAEPLKLDFELDDSKLPQEDSKVIRAIIKEEGLTEKQAKRLVAARAAEVAEFEKSNQDFEAEQDRLLKAKRREWDAELRNDPDFGKEKFGHNVKLVDKVLKDFGSEFEKALTDSNGVMPPYLMRMVARVGAKLYSTPNLEVGNPPPPPPVAENPDDHLDFYKPTLPKA